MTTIPNAHFGPCPLDAWLARQCGAATSRDLPARLAQKQLHLLRSTLDQAMRGAFYATRLQGYAFNLTTLEDLSHLPSPRQKICATGVIFCVFRRVTCSAW